MQEMQVIEGTGAEVIVGFGRGGGVREEAIIQEFDEGASGVSFQTLITPSTPPETNISDRAEPVLALASPWEMKGATVLITPM